MRRWSPLVRFFKKCGLLALLLTSALALAPSRPGLSAGSGVYIDIKESEAEDARVLERWKLYGSSYALIVGIDNYTNGWPRLSNAVKDAREVAKNLEERGFEVTLLTDLTGEELRVQLRRFFAISGRDPDARLFLWFAGHGHTENGEGYLVPADAPLPGGADFLLSAYPMRDFGSLVRLAIAKHAMAVFDSCFSGTVFAGQRSSPPAAITQATVKPVRQFLTSGDADQTVSDDGTFRSLFLSALSGDEDADANNDGYLTGSELSLHIENRVTNLSDGVQTPRSGKLRDRRFDQGDFVFLLPNRAPSLAEEAAQSASTASRSVDSSADTDAMELAFWQSIEDSIDPADFDAYLQAFPNGKFRLLVENRKKRLDSQQSALDTERAQELFEKAESAYFGHGKPRDPTAAVDSYRRAADMGHAGAQRMLGWIYQNGEASEPDPITAVKWYGLAAKAGNRDAQNDLGVMHAQGLGTARDSAQAFAWFERAAAQGHAEAQVNVGDAYRDGLGVDQDRLQAFDWYRRAAAQNNIAAQIRIAGLYEQGLFDQPDLREAVRWIRKAGIQSESLAKSQQARPAPRIKLVNREQEPNNIFGQANPVAPNTAAQGAITPRSDADWYSLEVGHQGELVVLFPEPPAELDMAFRVLTSDKAALTSWHIAERPGADAVGVIDLPAGGRYLIEVRDGKNDTASPLPYSMQLSFSATADWAEPNDTFGSAVSIELNQAYQANILPLGEADWYCFIAPHQGELTASITETPAALDVAVRVWDHDKNALTSWYYALSNGAENNAQFDLKSAGRYCLEVRDGKNDARSIDPYTLTPKFIASKDALEPNDTFGTAAEIELNKAYAANILPKGDVDWYCFVAKDQGRLDIVSAKPPGTLDISVRLWGADKNAITGWMAPLRVGGDLSANVDLAKPGRYCLEVRDGKNDSRAIEPYTLETRFAPTGDAYEPNDVFSAAGLIPTNAETTASLLPKGEADWYALDAVRQGRLQVTFKNVPENLDLAVRLWNADKSAISGWIYAPGPGADTVAEFDLPSTGQFFLEVRDGKNDASAAAPYTMATSLQAPD